MADNVLPDTQYAVQLVGPGELRLNPAKEVYRPGPHQVVARIEAMGLCFSDLKLLKQFTAHTRKGPIVRGIDPSVLAEIPSYKPGDAPVVPGHEGVCRIVAVGSAVTRHRVGERCLIQTDYRDLMTAVANAAFGYNFEGALQEYVLMDERVIIDPRTDRRFLIPVDDGPSASAVCLVEPWACVEDSYVNRERRSLKDNGALLVVADSGAAVKGLSGRVGSATAVCADDEQRSAVAALGAVVTDADGIDGLADESFDDIVYFGSDRRMIEALNDKLAAGGIMNIVLGGKRIGEPVSVGVGRVHYGMTRWTGTTGDDASEGYASIPETGEIRRGETIVVVGAGGPMGQMHVIRDICAGVPDVALTATDFDDGRLSALSAKAEPLAAANNVSVRFVNPQTTPMDEKSSYYALMAPVAPLVADAVDKSLPGCLINVFAGIPAPTRQALDLDTYIANRCFMFGTSGSVIRDMEIVLEKMASGRLDTNVSVDAVSGMAGAVDGIAAVENRTLAGKIIVYPMLHDLGLTPLSRLGEAFPTVAEKLDNGVWTRAAEDELLRVAG